MSLVIKILRDHADGIEGIIKVKFLYVCMDDLWWYINVSHTIIFA